MTHREDALRPACNDRVVGTRTGAASDFTPPRRPASSHPSRRTTRLQGYDYSQVGYYFVTICIHGRRPLLGAVTEGEMHLSPPGSMVRDVWQELAVYDGVHLDAFVVMPNHVHGIVVLEGTRDADKGRVPTGNGVGFQGQVEQRTDAAHDLKDLRQGPSLGDVIRRFKTMTVWQYGLGVKQESWPAYDKRLWQQRFYERVIRNDRELDAIREYIVNNPRQWALDRENPAFHG